MIDIAIPFEDFATFSHDLQRIISCSIAGVRDNIDRLDLTQALSELALANEETTEDEENVKIECKNNNAEWAANIIKSNYQTIYYFGMISLWAKLESTIYDFAALEILKNKTILSNREFSKVKAPISTYETLDDNEKAKFIVDTIVDQYGLQTKPGIDRFELILSFFKLDGPVDKDIKRTIYEFSQIRNIILHKSGAIDLTFKSNCPHLVENKQKKIHVTKEMFDNYIESTHKYLTIIINRLVARAKSRRQNKPANN